MLRLGALAYLFSLIPGLLAIYGNVRGGPWALGATIFLGALCVLDWIKLDDRRDPPGHPAWTPDLVLVLHVVVNALAIGSLLAGVATGTLKPWRVNDAALSTGLSSGLSGIVVAHELIHRRSKAWRAAGIFNLFLVNYTHFTIEHVQGHHKHVGTRRDPSTGRPRESVYYFLLRSLPMQYLVALRIEAERLRKSGRFGYGPSNFVVAATVFQALFLVMIRSILGPSAAWAFVMQGAVAVLVLQVVNYLQHSGLERDAGGRILAEHSWQSDRISDRFLLLELSRHADHHCHSTRPYHQLKSLENGPMLPHGLLGTIPVVLIPPLWFWVARRIVERLPIEAEQGAGQRIDLRVDDPSSTTNLRVPRFLTKRKSRTGR